MGLRTPMRGHTMVLDQQQKQQVRGHEFETNDPDPHQCRKRGIARNGNTYVFPTQ